MRTRWKILIVILIILIVILSIFSGSMRWIVHYACEPLRDMIFKKGNCCPVGHWGGPCTCIYPWHDIPSMCENSNNKIVNHTRSTTPPPESSRVSSPFLP